MYPRLEKVSTFGILRLIRCGKFQLSSAVHAGGTAFVVEIGARIRDEGTGLTIQRLREVWRGSRVSADVARPPKSPHLASVIVFTHIQFGADERLRVSKRDATFCFDQLQLPSALITWMARPPIILADLCSGPEGLTAAELEAALSVVSVPLEFCFLH